VELVDFLRQRLDEEERIALAACYWRDDADCHPSGGPFKHDRWIRCYVDENLLDNAVRTAMPEEGQDLPGSSLDPIPDGWIKVHDVASIAAVDDSHMPEYLGRHIARWDPARVLADVEADRKLIAEFLRCGPHTQGHVGLLGAVKIRAERFADHADYREEWRP
jgi:hypothetical protein